MKIVETGLIDELQRLVRILLTERREHVFHHFAHEALLILAHVRRAQAGQTFFLTGQLNRLGPLLAARTAKQSGLPLLTIERLEQLVRAFGLKPVGIAFVISLFIEAIRGVPVKNRPAKCSTLKGIAIAPPGHMPAG